MTDLIPYYAEVVHYAWQKRQEYVKSREEEFKLHLYHVERAQDPQGATISAKAFLEEIEEEGRRVFLNAYHASIHHLEGELTHA